MSPRFSVVTPVFDPPAQVLRETIASVLAQTFEDWELLLVDDASPSPHVREILAEFTSDPRIRIAHRETNGGIIAASNTALAMASGEFVVLLDHDDTIEPDALAVVHAVLTADPEIDYVYSDEDLLTPDGTCRHPFYKPDWSPERFRAQNYCCHLSVLRRSIVEEVGRFAPGFEGSQDYDLILRVTERARRVHHIARILYHWRQLSTSVAGNPTVKMYAYESGQRAIQAHCDRIGIDAIVEMQEPLGTYRVRRVLTNHPLVSIIIPTCGTQGRVWGIERAFVVDAITSILERSTYRNIEFVVVADTSTPADVISAIERAAGDRLELVWFDGEFNFSEKVNVGRVHSRGEFLLLLNDDVEVITPDFLETMVGLVRDPDVGSVGAKLLFSDGTLQHVGHLYNPVPHHIFFKWNSHEFGPSGMLTIERECSGVTAACLMIRPDVFDEVGGFAPDFKSNYNDVDFALKLLSAGYRNVITPHAVLYHFESVSRDPVVTPQEFALLHQRWADRMATDPYSNPNLEPGRNDWIARVGR
jgi:GT2 family glycosyltransferase